MAPFDRRIMVTVNRNMFDASIVAENGSSSSRASLLVLPLNVIAIFISYIEDAADLARLCQTCRLLNYMALPQLYKDITLTSYDKIRYRGDEPEGSGGASPFSMGLSALITRPYPKLVKSIALRGEWQEHDLEVHARVGRVPDSSMMLSISVRAAVDRMTELESFSWELNTKALETVYVGLSQLPKLTSLSIRFPSSRHPRPTTVIPLMPHLRYLKVTDIDPLCYPDDISSLLSGSKKLRELKMHWSPRMRNAQEPSVVLHDYFRKCTAAKQRLKIRKLALQNLYALHNEDFINAMDADCMEEVTILSDAGGDDGVPMNTFVDRSWPAPRPGIRMKAMRHDMLSKRHYEFLSSVTGLERLYFVNSRRGPHDQVNTPRISTNGATTPGVENSMSAPNGTSGTPGQTESNAGSPTGPFHLQFNLRDNYLTSVFTNHGTTLRHLLLPSHWPLSGPTIARLVHACPQLEQLALATELSSVETLGLLLPFLRKLVALRLLIPTRKSPSSACRHINEQRAPRSSGGAHSPPSASAAAVWASLRSFADLVELEDEFLSEKLSVALADEKTYGNLRIVGLGWKAWEVRGFYSTPHTLPREVTNGTLSGPALQHQNSVGECVTEFNSDGARDSPAGIGQRTVIGSSGTGISMTTHVKQFLKNGSPSNPLGKRNREGEIQKESVPLSAPPRSCSNNPEIHSAGDALGIEVENHDELCLSMCLTGDGRIRRRRLKRVGWEVLRNWEIWALDTQEI